jgi:hypothetical protein
MDRTAILTNHTDALAASVLNPAPQKASLLPFLSALAPDNSVTEAILRPRMPVILCGKLEGAATVEVEDEDMEKEEDDDDGVEAADIEDEEQQRPSGSGWATAITAETEKTHVSWNMGDTVKEQSHESRKTSDAGAQGGLSIKRVANEETHSGFHNKKARVGEDDPRAHNAAVFVTEVESIEQTEEIQMRVATDVALAGAEAESDDEDESDFEIPPLVMRTDFDDEDEEDEEEEEEEEEE